MFILYYELQKRLSDFGAIIQVTFHNLSGNKLKKTYFGLNFVDSIFDLFVVKVFLNGKSKVLVDILNCLQHEHNITSIIQ